MANRRDSSAPRPEKGRLREETPGRSEEERRKAVEGVRPVCANASRWDCTLEPTGYPDRFAVRLGLRQVRRLSNVDTASIVLARADRPFASIDDLWRRAGVPAASLVKIAEADGFHPSM